MDLWLYVGFSAPFDLSLSLYVSTMVFDYNRLALYFTVMPLAWFFGLKVFIICDLLWFCTNCKDFFSVSVKSDTNFCINCTEPRNYFPCLQIF